MHLLCAAIMAVETLALAWALRLYLKEKMAMSAFVAACMLRGDRLISEEELQAGVAFMKKAMRKDLIGWLQA